MGGDGYALLIALVVVGLLGVLLRWIFAPPRWRRRVITRPVDASRSEALGLLTVVATALNRQDAMTARARLGDRDIRSSMSVRRDGLFDVLVFHGDADDARDVLA